MLDLPLSSLKKKYDFTNNEKYKEWKDKCGEFQYRYIVERKNQPLRSHISESENTIYLETDIKESKSGINDTLNDSTMSKELAELKISSR